MDQMNSNNDQAPDDAGQSETTPFDDIINRVRGYIKDPTQVTHETLSELLTELEDLKSVVDGEESGEPTPEPQPQNPNEKPSLTIAIDKGMRGGH